MRQHSHLKKASNSQMTVIRRVTSWIKILDACYDNNFIGLVKIVFARWIQTWAKDFVNEFRLGDPAKKPISRIWSSKEIFSKKWLFKTHFPKSHIRSNQNSSLRKVRLLRRMENSNAILASSLFRLFCFKKVALSDVRLFESWMIIIILTFYFHLPPVTFALLFSLCIFSHNYPRLCLTRRRRAFSRQRG